MAQRDFDLKHLIRTITTSTTYQLSSTPNEYNQKAGRSFARFQPRRLAAEVLLDGIDVVTGTPTPFGGNSPVKRAIELPDESVPLRGGYRGNFLEVFGKPKRDSACECERVTAASLTQSLYMIGSEEIHRKLKDRNSRAAKLAADEQPMADKIDELFLSTFARHPTRDELISAETYITAEIAFAEKETSSTQRLLMKQWAWEDLIWALMNQGLYLFTPSADLLSFSNTVSGEHAWKLLHQALEKFEPPATLPKLLKGHEDAGPLWTLPDGSQLVLVNSKVLGGYEESDSPSRRIHQQSLGRDHLWLTGEEIASLSTGQFPKSLTKRMPALLNDHRILPLAPKLNGSICDVALLIFNQSKHRVQRVLKTVTHE